MFSNTQNMNNYLVSNEQEYYFTKSPFKYHRNNIWPGFNHFLVRLLSLLEEGK